MYSEYSRVSFYRDKEQISIDDLYLCCLDGYITVFSVVYNRLYTNGTIASVDNIASCLENAILSEGFDLVQYLLFLYISKVAKTYQIVNYDRIKEFIPETHRKSITSVRCNNGDINRLVTGFFIY
jgi:hypothetical protein